MLWRVSVREVLAEAAELSRGGLVHAADDVEQRGLAAARLAEQHEELALVHVEVDAAQDLGDRVAFLELARDATQLDDRLAVLPRLEAGLVLGDGLRHQHAHDLDDVGVVLGEAAAARLVDHLHHAVVLEGARERRADGGGDLDALEVRLRRDVGIGLEPQRADGLLVLVRASHGALAHGVDAVGDVVGRDPVGGMELLVALLVVEPDDGHLGSEVVTNDLEAGLEGGVERCCLRDGGVDLAERLERGERVEVHAGAIPFSYAVCRE